MKALLSLLLVLVTAFSAGAGERVIMYAMLTEGMQVDLTDGSKWQMDKGDCFPVVAYKQSHTKLILQLAGAQFMVPADKTRIVTQKELDQAVQSYRANVNTYIGSYSNRWKDGAKDPGAEPAKDPGKEPKKSE